MELTHFEFVTATVTKAREQLLKTFIIIWSSNYTITFYGLNFEERYFGLSSFFFCLHFTFINTRTIVYVFSRRGVPIKKFGRLWKDSNSRHSIWNAMMLIARPRAHHPSVIVWLPFCQAWLFRWEDWCNLRIHILIEREVDWWEHFPIPRRKPDSRLDIPLGWTEYAPCFSMRLLGPFGCHWGRNLNTT